jgi:DNA modification methylase
MDLTILEKLPADLRYQLIEGITAKWIRQSDLARMQLALATQIRSRIQQGERTDLRAKLTCTPADVQVGDRRESTVEKVGAFFGEGGGTVRRRLYIQQKACEEPELYGKFLNQMDDEDSCFKAYAALKAAEHDEKFDQERIPERGRSHVERGDVWRLGDHRLACGDATCSKDVARLLEGEVPILMVTDPPYGVDYEPSWRVKIGNSNASKIGFVTNDDRVDWSEAWQHFPGDVAYVWFADRHATAVQTSLTIKGLEFRDLIVWAKPYPVISRGHYRSQAEFCFYTVREGRTAHWQTSKSQSNVWTFNNREDRGHGHPTQKAVGCMLQPMENHTAEGDAVYDPFVGSGTTIIAAEESGRRCYAMEIDPGHCAVAIERWQRWTNRTAVVEASGESYIEIMRRRSTEIGSADVVAKEKWRHEPSGRH